MKRNIVILAQLLLFALPTGAQVTQSWVMRYNGPGNGTDCPVAMAVDPTGNIYVTGYSVGSETGKDIVLIKYTPEGTQVWVQRYDVVRYNYHQNETPADIGIDMAGNVYVVGTTGDYNYTDCVILKYDSSGVLQWARTYDGPSHNTGGCNAIAVDPVGNLYVAGWTYGTTTNYLLMKYNTYGDSIWTRQYDGYNRDLRKNGNDQATGVALDMYGNAYVTGTCDTHYDYDNQQREYSFVTVKYDAQGIQQWVADYSGFQNISPPSIAIDPYGNIVIGGSISGTTWAGDMIPARFCVAQYNSSGTRRWNAEYKDYENSFAALGVDNSGNVFVTGQHYTGYRYPDFATIKYDTAGKSIWNLTYDGPIQGTETPTSLAVDQDGSNYVAGTREAKKGDFDYVVVKYGSAGVLRWVQSYGGADDSTDEIKKIILDQQGNVYVTGQSYSRANGYDIVTIKYVQSGIVAPTIAISNPNGNSVWQVGSTSLIECFLENVFGKINVRLSTDGGSTYPRILANNINQSRQFWVNVPNSPSAQCKIRIEQYSDTSRNGQSSGLFVIPTPSLTTNKPDSASVWYIGESRTLPWNSSNLGGNINIRLSLDSGRTYRYMLVSGATNTGSATFTVPERPSLLCKLRVESAVDPNIFGTSPGLFCIAYCVYPGDANNDGIVDVRDILPIGRYYKISGPQRGAHSVTWGDQPLTGAWNPVAAGYADCDGNGIVDEDDVIGIIDNWFRIRGSIAQPTIQRKAICEELLQEIDSQGSLSSGMEAIRNVVLSVLHDTSQSIPREYALGQNWPNPFNPRTAITFSIPQDAPAAKFYIFNVVGDLIWEKSWNALPAGIHTIVWQGATMNGGTAGSGVYYYELVTHDFRAVKKMILVK